MLISILSKSQQTAFEKVKYAFCRHSIDNDFVDMQQSNTSSFNPNIISLLSSKPFSDLQHSSKMVSEEEDFLILSTEHLIVSCSLHFLGKIHSFVLFYRY